MPKQIKTCRVCGATYEACNSARSGNKAFNWREVACSPECGMVYLDKITASRSIVEPVEEAAVMRFPRKKKVEKPEPELKQVVEAEEEISVEAEVSESEDIEVTE